MNGHICQCVLLNLIVSRTIQQHHLKLGLLALVILCCRKDLRRAPSFWYLADILLSSIVDVSYAALQLSNCRFIFNKTAASRLGHFWESHKYEISTIALLLHNIHTPMRDSFVNIDMTSQFLGKDPKHPTVLNGWSSVNDGQNAIDLQVLAVDTYTEYK